MHASPLHENKRNRMFIVLISVRALAQNITAVEWNVLNAFLNGTVTYHCLYINDSGA
jgi:hypothetical protein